MLSRSRTAFFVCSMLLAIARAAAAADCPPPGEWSTKQKALWTDIVCAGQAIDLSDARDGEDRLSARFLSDILTVDPWREVTARKGIRIQGAVFAQAIRLERFAVDRDIWFESCVFEKGLTLNDVTIKGGLSLWRSRFGTPGEPGDVLLETVRIGSNLYLSEIAARNVQVLAGRIDGNLLAIRQGWDEARTNRLYLQATRIDGELVIESERIDTLYLNETVVRQGMKIAQATRQPPPRFKRIMFTGLKVENGGLHLDAVESEELLIDLSTLGGSLTVRGGKQRSVSVRSSSIGGWIQLGSDRTQKPLEWTSGGHVDLLDVHVRVIATDDQWPTWDRSLRLEDLHLDRVIEKGAPAEKTREANDLPGDSPPTNGEGTQAIVRWLSRTSTTALEPYYALAEVVRKRGEVDQSHDIMVAGWERRRADSHGLGWLWLTIKHYLINYGYEPYRALIAVGLLVLLGMGVLALSNKAEKNGFGFWYSVDFLLPFVTLIDTKGKEELEPWVRRYFYIHQLLGWLFASFLIAAVSGLLK